MLRILGFSLKCRKVFKLTRHESMIDYIKGVQIKWQKRKKRKSNFLLIIKPIISISLFYFSLIFLNFDFLM